METDAGQVVRREEPVVHPKAAYQIYERFGVQFAGDESAGAALP